MHMATAIRMPGRRGQRLRSRISASVAPPIAKATRLVRPSSSCSTASTWRSGPSASTLKPSSLGIWLSSTVSAMPFM